MNEVPFSSLSSYFSSRIRIRVQAREELENSARIAQWPALLPRQTVTLAPSGAAEVNAAFTVTQFNVLADALSGADPNLGGFVKTPRDALDWACRKHRSHIIACYPCALF